MSKKCVQKNVAYEKNSNSFDIMLHPSKTNYVQTNIDNQRGMLKRTLLSSHLGTECETYFDQLIKTLKKNVTARDFLISVSVTNSDEAGRTRSHT